MLLCSDCAELERPSEDDRSERVSVGESARSKRYIFFSTYAEVSSAAEVRVYHGRLTERICFPEMIFLAFSNSGLRASTKTS